MLVNCKYIHWMHKDTPASRIWEDTKVKMIGVLLGLGAKVSIDTIHLVGRYPKIG